jgi:hypothetical protein
MADDGRVRELLLELRRELVKVKPSVETSIAWDDLDRLQQSLWRVGIEVRGASGVMVSAEEMHDRAISALLELGNNRRGAEVLVKHLVNRGIIDLTAWRPILCLRENTRISSGLRTTYPQFEI